MYINVLHTFFYLIKFQFNNKMVLFTEEQKKFYKDNGYIVIKNVLTKEQLDEISTEYDKLFASKDQQKLEYAWLGKKHDRTHEGDSTVKGIHNLQNHNAVFNKYIFNENLIDALEGCIGTKDIILHHTKAHIKPPEKGAAYPMHQDYHYFPYKKDTLVAAFLHLDAAGPENGGLCVYPGSHNLGPQEDVGIKVSDFRYVDQAKFPLSGATPIIAEKGDVVIFSYLLVHGSPPNTSTRTRRMLLMQAGAADDTPINELPQQPGYGWLLRGVNVDTPATLEARFAS